MRRFFEIVETDGDTFIKATGTDYNDKRVIVPIDGTVFVVINDKKKHKLRIPIACFDDEIFMIVNKEVLWKTEFKTRRKKMSRYFKIIEIDADTFSETTGEILDCSQVIAPINGKVYVAVDDQEEYEMNVPLDSFDE